MDGSRSQIEAIEEVRATLAASGETYVEFLRRGMFSAGLYKLAAGATDEQTPHHEDEIYYVVAGRAMLEVEGSRQAVEPGSIAFVAAEAGHRFIDITEDLEVLVFFAPPETG